MGTNSEKGTFCKTKFVTRNVLFSKFVPTMGTFGYVFSYIYNALQLSFSFLDDRSDVVGRLVDGRKVIMGQLACHKSFTGKKYIITLRRIDGWRR